MVFRLYEFATHVATSLQEPSLPPVPTPRARHQDSVFAVGPVKPYSLAVTVPSATMFLHVRIQRALGLVAASSSEPRFRNRLAGLVPVAQGVNGQLVEHPVAAGERRGQAEVALAGIVRAVNEVPMAVSTSPIAARAAATGLALGLPEHAQGGLGLGEVFVLGIQGRGEARERRRVGGGGGIFRLPGDAHLDYAIALASCAATSAALTTVKNAFT